MESEKFLKSKTFKLLLPFVVILGIIVLARTGYEFGQWLHQAIN